MRSRAWVLITSSLVFGAPFAFAIPDIPIPTSEESTSSEDQAKATFNSGLASLEKGDSLTAEAASQTSAAERERLLASAREAYAAARKDFESATQLAPEMPEAWNGLGYTQRKLGDYDAALASYERALTLRPDYVEAIEYRGEAYLGLNRIEDAKQAYLDLFAKNRDVSAKLLAAMKDWVREQRSTPGKVDASKVDELEKWLQEREQIASQTASLTRESAATGWR